MFLWWCRKAVEIELFHTRVSNWMALFKECSLCVSNNNQIIASRRNSLTRFKPNTDIIQSKHWKIKKYDFFIMFFVQNDQHHLPPLHSKVPFDI